MNTISTRKTAWDKNAIKLVMPGVCRRYEDQYQLKPLLSYPEMTFFLILQSLAQGRCVITCKPRLADYIERLQEGDLRKISQKHVDFLICRNDDMLPIFAIELDGSSHNSPDARERDIFVNELSSSIGLPLLRVPIKFMHDLEFLVDRLTDAWTKGSMQPHACPTTLLPALA